MGLGPRTPALIISPYTVAGHNPDGGSIDSTVYEFSSVLRFIEDLHGLDPMTDRDAQASPLAGAFDFTQPPRLDVPKLHERDCPTREAVRRRGGAAARAAVGDRGAAIRAATSPLWRRRSIGPSRPRSGRGRRDRGGARTAAVWRLTFARTDRGGGSRRGADADRHPRSRSEDPGRLPSATSGGVNRIVRWDRHLGGSTRSRSGGSPSTARRSFNPPVIEGNTVELRVPGGSCSGSRANGTESVHRLRWSVLVRDGSACDRLGGRPRFASPPSTVDELAARARGIHVDRRRRASGSEAALPRGRSRYRLGAAWLWGPAARWPQAEPPQRSAPDSR